MFRVFVSWLVLGTSCWVGLSAMLSAVSRGRRLSRVPLAFRLFYIVATCDVRSYMRAYEQHTNNIVAFFFGCTFVLYFFPVMSCRINFLWPFLSISILTALGLVSSQVKFILYPSLFCERLFSSFLLWVSFGVFLGV